MGSSSKEIVDLTVTVHHKTENAVFVSGTGDRDDAVWVPRSQLEFYEEGKDGMVEISLPEWLAIEKGFV